MTPPERHLDFHQTLPGRLFLLSGALLLALVIVQQFVELPVLLSLFRKVVSLAFLGSGVWLLVVAIVRNRRRLLWRVRRKLILSYIFIGLFPVLLVAIFAFAVAEVFYVDVSAYMFHEGFNDLADNVQQFAETSGIEVARSPTTIETGIERKVANLKSQFSELSMAVVPIRGGGAVIAAGPWQHTPPPATIPGWVVLARSFHGVVPLLGDGSHDPRLIIRAVSLTADGTRAVVADLPIDTDVVARLDDRTSARVRGITLKMNDSASEIPIAPGDPAPGGVWSVFQRTQVYMDCVDWETGRAGRVTLALDAPLGRLYERLAASQSLGGSATNRGQWANFLKVLGIVAVLFLIIQGSALFLGGTLAHMITSAVHELFTGTERVQHGDFAHRINITSRDQLGDLADSFNRMSASIEHLLHVQREKQRLDDELRIARDIQKSLLPVQPPRLEGLGVADLCEPAREVGGDYYDFFNVGPRQLGVLVADVSGKGTSAALYMAELKGVMLALSQAERSPRRLLIDVNRLLAAHLDNRSFITMTYAVLDLDRGTLTSARAGHPPLIVASNGTSEVVLSSGMVLGLRLPGASDRFEEVLEEHTRSVGPGDAIVLYTDGITEAMDRDGELFGDEALRAVVTAHAKLDAAGIRERVLREVKAFVGDAEPHDDMTMVVLKIQEHA